MARVVAYVAHLLDGADRPPEATPLMKAGLWPSTNALEKSFATQSGAYFLSRACAIGPNGPRRSDDRGFRQRGARSAPNLCFKFERCRKHRDGSKAFSEHKPDIVLNATGFAISTPNQGLTLAGRCACRFCLGRSRCANFRGDFFLLHRVRPWATNAQGQVSA